MVNKPQAAVGQTAVGHATADLEPGPVALQPRDVRFDWSGLPLRWIPGEPVASHVLSTLHLLLPEGERWFVRTFKQALPFIRDEELREDVIGFIGQEAIHAEAHQGVLDYYTDHGVDTARYLRHMEWLFHRILGDRPGMAPAGERELLIEHVAIVAAIEHFTAMMGASSSTPTRWTPPAPIPGCSTCCAGTARRKSSTATSRSTCSSTSTLATRGACGRSSS